MDVNAAQKADAGGGWTAANIYTLAMITIVYGFNTVDRSVFGLLAPAIKADLDLSDTMIGLLAGFAFAAFHAIAAIPIGSLADRWNRRNIIAIGVSFWSLMMALHGLVANAWQLAVTRFLLGAGEATNVAPSNSIIADLFAPTHRPLALGIMSSATSLGIMLAFPVLGHVSNTYGWRMSFIAAGLPGIAIGLLFFLTVKEPPRAALIGSPERVRLAPVIGRLISKPGFVFTVLAGTLTAFSLGVMVAWTPTLLTRVHGLSQSDLGASLGVLRGVGGLVGAIVGGALASWLSRHDPRWRYRVPAIAMLLVAPAQALLIFGDGAGWRIGLLLETMLVMAQFGPFFAMVLESADSRTRSVAIALFLFSSNIFGQGGGPLLTGYLSDLLAPSIGLQSIRFAMLIATAATLAAFVCCMMGGRYLQRQGKLFVP